MTFTKNKACAAMGKMIASIQASIAREERSIQAFNTRISFLQKQVPPNTALIAELQVEVEAMVKQAAMDNFDLQAFHEEFVADCVSVWH